MSIVNAETGELVQPMDEDSARRLTERIRIAAANYTEAKAKVLALVDEAKAGNAHVALGYKSWTAYLSDVLSDEPLRLARDERRELVTRLADEGMSARAIAPIVGVDHATVARDVEASTVANATVETEGPKPPPVVRTITGLDGRERTTVTAGQVKRPAPNPSRETTLVNDIRLYLRTMSTSREVRDLTPEGRQHIVDALIAATTHIQEIR